jgi:hypothetical protein
MQTERPPELRSAQPVPSPGQLDTISVAFRADHLGEPPVHVLMLNNDFLLSQPIRFIPVSP